MTYRAFGRLFALLTAIVIWAALAVPFQRTVEPLAADGHWLEAGLLLLNSFAVPANILAALSLTIAAFAGPRVPWPALMMAVTLYLVLGLVLFLFHLDGGDAANGPARMADLALHVVVPALVALYWLLVVPKGHARPLVPFLSLVYPAIFLVAVVWRGSVTGHIPYPLLDIAKLGNLRVALICAEALGVVLAAGLAFRAIDRLLRPLAMP